MKNKNRVKTSLCILCLTLTMLMPIQVFGADVSAGRLAGNDRYETGVKIAQAGWSAAENVVIATGTNQNMADLLTIAPFAKLKSAPILLTEGSKLNTETKAEIERLGAKTAYIASGSGVISQSLKDELVQMGLNSITLGGQDRFETAVNIAKEIAKIEVSDTVIVTTAAADALSIVSLAAAKGWPILLSEKNYLPESAVSFISNNKIKRFFIIGETGIIGGEVQNSLPGAVRLGSADRFTTNLEILKYFDSDFDYSNGLFTASGDDDFLVDSLVASSYIAGSPLLLISNELPIMNASQEWLMSKNINKIIALTRVSIDPQNLVEQIVPTLETYSGNSNGVGGRSKAVAKTGSEPATESALPEIVDVLKVAEDVMNGITYAGETVRLSEDVELNEEVSSYLSAQLIEFVTTGVFDTPFLGAFDGGGHSITTSIQISDSDKSRLKSLLKNPKDALVAGLALVSEMKTAKVTVENVNLVISEIELAGYSDEKAAALLKKHEIKALEILLRGICKNVSITLPDGAVLEINCQ